MRISTHTAPTIQDRITNTAIPPWMNVATTRVRLVLESVSDEFFVDAIDILSGSYASEAVEARMACYWIMHKISRLSHVQIARCFGRKDHSSVCNGIKKTEERRTRDPLFKEMTDAALTKSEAARPRSLAVAIAA